MHRLIAVCALVSSSCATFRPPLTGPADGGPAWIEVTSPHFVVHTDMPEEDARARIAEFERDYDILADLAFRSSTMPDDRVEVVVFERSEDYRVFPAFSWMAAYATHVDSDNRSRLVMPALYGDRERAVFLHELTHRFVRYFMPGAPAWLNEGIAKFYETMRVDGKNAVIGESPYRFLRSGNFVKGKVPLDRLPPPSALTALKPEQFYVVDTETVELDYAASWMLVSMLITGPDEGRKRFWDMVRALDQGTAADDAWSASFAGFNVDDAFHEYKSIGKTGVGRVPYQTTTTGDAKVAVRAMRDDEVRVLWVSLGGAKNEHTKNEIARALAEAPSSPEAHYWAAKIAQANKDDATALAEALRAAQLAPEEPRYLLALDELRLSREMKKKKPDRVFEDVAHDVDVLAKFDKSAEAQRFVANYYADIDDAARATPFVQRALDINPACWQCLDTLARVTAMTGSARDAVAVERRALAAYPHAGAPPKHLLDRLAKLEEKARVDESAHAAVDGPPAQAP